MNKPKLLVVGDSPTVATGFGNVVRNLCQRWLPHFREIHCWSLNYAGIPHDLPYKIWPGGFGDWTSDHKLIDLLNLIGSSDYTHLFILCDSHNLSHGKVPEFFERICRQKKVVMTFYYPVDSPMEKSWLNLVALADNAVTYTEYGREETRKVMPKLNPHVIPHGVDTSVFYPLENRMTLREEGFQGWVRDDDFLMVNVNRNEKRKGIQHSLQILKELKRRQIHNVKMLLHMPRMAAMNENVDIEMVGAQLGIPHGIYWKHSDELFQNQNARMTEDALNQLYNCADLVLSTSLGEGWGLSVSEGLAAGCQVAAPNHTSLACIHKKVEELGQTGQMHLLPTSPVAIVNPLDSSRVRFPVDIEKSADVIEGLVANHAQHAANRFVLNDAVKDWLSWDRVAKEFLRVMGVQHD